MKKWFAACLLIVVLCIGTYKTGMNYISTNMIDQIVKDEDIEKILADPTIMKQLENEVSSSSSSVADQKEKSVRPTNNSASEDSLNQHLSFASKQDALSFLLTKFSTGELMNYASKAKGGITQDDRRLIESEVMSRLSSEELKALTEIGIAELSNR